MENLINRFQKYIVIALMLFMGLIIVISICELTIILFNELTNPVTEKGIVLNTQEIIRVFGFFFNVLIAFELFETIKLYLKDGKFHGEIILMIGIVAIARKVIVLDFTKEDPILIIALGLMIGFLSAGYYLIKKRT